jgi:hypothetical protein
LRGIAAGGEPAHENEDAAGRGGSPAHDVSNPLGVGRHLGSQPREDLDDDHAGAAARAWGGQRARRVRRGVRRLLRLDGRRVGGEQPAGFCDVPGAVGVGEEPVMADAVSVSRNTYVIDIAISFSTLSKRRLGRNALLSMKYLHCKVGLAEVGSG